MARIVIAAGGTAGHVVPALAIADELRASGAEVAFIGSRDRVEAELVPAAGYDFTPLAVSGLDRRRPLRAARAGIQAAGATAQALGLLRRLRPDAVLCAGGYVGWPVGAAALLRRTPIVLTESDSRLGIANRALAPFARRVCLAFPIAGRSGERYVVTGRPVPRAVAEADRAAARERLGVDAAVPCLVVFGGSLGARSINDAAFEAFAAATSAGQELVVLHIAGRRDYAELRARLDAVGRPARYRLFEYLENLADPLAACDLAVARAGGSVFEIAAAGRPAVLVPYPRATGAHQETNARWMADAGAAVVIPDRELGSDVLGRTVGKLLGDRERLAAMAAASRRLARPDAAARVARELLDAAGGQGELPWAGRRLHFIAIGGAGMSALALVARELGADVSGCDRAESAYTRLLRARGIEPAIGHSPEHVSEAIDVVVSTAIPADLPELVAARERGATVIHRGALLAEVTALRRLIAIAGTHGKTTTAAMTAHCLAALGLEPAYLIGAELRADAGERGEAAHAAWGSGGWIVAEADESDRSFLELAPEVGIVTNVELDHHSTYGSLIELEQAFATFLGALPERGAVAILDRPALARLAPAGRRVLRFDVEHDAGGRVPDLSARAVVPDGLGSRFELARSGVPVCEVELPVPGEHNVLNALAALAACDLVGADVEQAARALATFRPAARRFEPKGEAGGVRVFDDYAHHPTEVAATLAAARALGPERLVAVFQPHLYSRTLELAREFGAALAAADVVVVLDVYPARERPEGKLAGVSGKLVADACADRAGGRPVWWLPTLDEAEEALARLAAPGDVVLTLGAGDVDLLAERLVARLRRRDPPPGGGTAFAPGTEDAAAAAVVADLL
jgi:UDP-N-acetylmuramate--alanine ligase